MEDLQEELVIEILLKLAVSDLLRCKSVCKSWFSIINTPSFINQHLEVLKHINNNPHFLLCSKNLRDTTQRYNSISIVSHQTLGVYEHVTSDPILYIVGCYNGIVCIFNSHTRKNDILLWNPATRHKKYVTSYYQTQAEESFNHLVLKTHGLGFGFDPKNNDYKVVSIKIYDSALGTELPRPPIEILVYSSKTGSWTRVSDGKLAIKIISWCVCTEGMYSWKAKIETTRGIRVAMEFVIISFDMTNQLLISTPLPSNINGTHACSPVAYNRSLAVIVSDLNDTEYNVWVLGEYGVRESWTKLFSIRSKEIEFLVGLRDNSLQFLSFKSSLPGKEEELVLFDPITKQTNSFPNFIHGLLLLQLSVIDFTESLVPITNVV